VAVIGIVPAAGQGARFAAASPGAPHKLLTPIDGVAMVRRTVAALLEGGAERCVVVVSAEGETAIRAALAEMPVTLRVNPDPARGMFSSIQIGVAETEDADGCVLLPGDMPYVQPATIAAVVATCRCTKLPVLAGHAGRRGHPIAWSASLRARVLQAPAGTTLSEERSHEAIVLIEVPDPGVHRDVDHPSDLNA
jgi:molybdenum cofactor cytidylyltransferase